jgi:VanZ family protein
LIHPAFMKQFLRYWLPLVLWMVLIFSASGDEDSVARTSRFLEPFLRWFAPDISPESIDRVRLIVRKGAHVFEFAVLAWLWWRALRSRGASREWSWSTAGIAFGISVLYAGTDEFHQLFVDGRGGSIVDVFIDAAGAALALGILWMIERKRSLRP